MLWSKFVVQNIFPKYVEVPYEALTFKFGNSHYTPMEESVGGILELYH